VKLKLLALLLLLLGCDRPTSGARIPVYDHPQIALVVLDPHHGMLVEPTLGVVNRLVSGAQPLGVSVALVKTESLGDVDPGVAAGDLPVFTKSRGDAFSSRELDAFLRSRSVDHLVLVGASADGSITLTTEGARNRGYKVQIVEDAVGAATADRRDRAIRSLRSEGVEVLESERLLAEWARRKRWLSSR